MTQRSVMVVLAGQVVCIPIDTLVPTVGLAATIRLPVGASLWELDLGLDLEESVQ
jgi:hypothetical protein